MDSKIRYTLAIFVMIPVLMFVAHLVARTIFRAWFKTKQEMLPTEPEVEKQKGKG